MRRIVLALAMTVGLAIGTVVPASALDTSVTLNCSDGTSVKLLVDADTLTGLTQAVQAMIDYPAGLSCTLIQNPLGVTFGSIALASGSGTESFIVGGGRYQLPCNTPGTRGLPGTNFGGIILLRDDTIAPTVASSPSDDHTTFGSSRIKIKLVSSYQPLADTATYWVNIAVNVHQNSDGSLNFFGTLNETIPDGQCAAHGHFTSRPTCLTLDATTPKKALVVSTVTQTSGDTSDFFIGGPVLDGSTPSGVSFSFKDNGNPGQQIFPTPGKDKLDGILGAVPGCPFPDAVPEPLVDLDNGNITVHPQS